MTRPEISYWTSDAVLATPVRSGGVVLVQAALGEDRAVRVVLVAPCRVLQRTELVLICMLGSRDGGCGSPLLLFLHVRFLISFGYEVRPRSRSRKQRL